MMETVMESRPPGLKLHLKVLVYHGDRLRAGEPLPLELLAREAGADAQAVVPREAGSTRRLFRRFIESQGPS